MKHIVAVIAFALLLPASAFAQQNNVGSCGWGSKLMDGRSGIFPQVLATFTNGTLGNQTFAISSGTSGCTQDGVVRSSWKTAMFIDANKNKIARDMSVGHGESLESLAAVMGVKEGDKALFFSLAKKNFANIFPSEEVSTDNIVASLDTVVSSSSQLSYVTIR